MRDSLGSAIVIVLICFIVIFSFNLPPLQAITNLLQQPFGILLGPFNAPAEFVAGLWEGLEQGDRLRKYNADLQERIGELESEVASLQEVARENQYLRELLRLQQNEPKLQRSMAKVVASRDPNSLLRSVTIIPARDEVFREGMTVVTAAGLVGRIVQANPRSAKVMLITDTSSAVTAIDQETRAAGVVAGQRGPLLLMRYISQGDVVRPGDMVVTSGVGGVFPEGIPIGKIVSISRRDVDLYQQALIEPMVDFENLERLLVITNYVPLKLD